MYFVVGGGCCELLAVGTQSYAPHRKQFFVRRPVLVHLVGAQAQKEREILRSSRYTVPHFHSLSISLAQEDRNWMQHCSRLTCFPIALERVVAEEVEVVVQQREWKKLDANLQFSINTD